MDVGIAKQNCITKYKQCKDKEYMYIEENIKQNIHKYYLSMALRNSENCSEVVNHY